MTTQTAGYVYIYIYNICDKQWCGHGQNLAFSPLPLREREHFILHNFRLTSDLFLFVDGSSHTSCLFSNTATGVGRTIHAAGAIFGAPKPPVCLVTRMEWWVPTVVEFSRQPVCRWQEKAHLGTRSGICNCCFRLKLYQPYFSLRRFTR
jgi:hypothetical protein